MEAYTFGVVLIIMKQYIMHMIDMTHKHAYVSTLPAGLLVECNSNEKSRKFI